MRSKKIITLAVSDSQLNALEDLLFAELTTEQTKKLLPKAKKLFINLVDAYDKTFNHIPNKKTIKAMKEAEKLLSK